MAESTYLVSVDILDGASRGRSADLQGLFRWKLIGVFIHSFIHSRALLCAETWDSERRWAPSMQQTSSPVVHFPGRFVFKALLALKVPTTV